MVVCTENVPFSGLRWGKRRPWQVLNLEVLHPSFPLPLPGLLNYRITDLQGCGYRAINMGYAKVALAQLDPKFGEAESCSQRP